MIGRNSTDGGAMRSARPVIIAALVAATLLSSAYAQAEWYAGVGLNGLHSDQEHDGDIETELSFLGPRVYGGWRLSDRLALEVEAGWAEFRGRLFSDTLNADLEMWNVAVTGIVYVPVAFPMRPFFYVGAGRSLWNYDIVPFFAPAGYTDSSNDPYSHAGLGMESALGDNLRLRIGYRLWRTKMHPQEGQWAVDTDDYSYRRRGMEVTAHWAF